jgi:nucleoid-associated protein YgaU
MLPAVKIVMALVGLTAFGGAVAIFGLPPKPPKPSAPAVQEAAKPAPALPEQVASAKLTPVEEPKPAAIPAPAPVAIPAPAPVAIPALAPAAIPAPVPPDALQNAFAAPEFDIVRVEPSGDLVVAGRAPAGSAVELLRDGQIFDRGQADQAGRFALVPRPLPPGTAQLSLIARAADGRSEASRQSVTISVPERAKQSEVVVALSAPNQPTQLLTPPAVPPPPALPPATDRARPQVVITTVESEESGAFFASGTAVAGASVRLYLNETFIASATASPDGRWSFSVQKGVEPGRYRVRLDDVERLNGTVLSRAEVSFDVPPRQVAALQPTRPAPEAEPRETFATAPSANVIVDEVRTATVSRGDSLWRISRKIYGSGIRYTVIHEANQTQIRNPDKIYPGQVFVLPMDAPAGAKTATKPL